MRAESFADLLLIELLGGILKLYSLNRIIVLGSCLDSRIQTFLFLFCKNFID